MRNIWGFLFSLFLTILLILQASVQLTLQKVEKAWEKMFEPLMEEARVVPEADQPGSGGNVKPLPKEGVTVFKPEAGEIGTWLRPIVFLFIGVDERLHDHGRADTLIVAVLQPALEETMLISIPRDTRTEIAGLGKEDKINHAYAFGNSKMAVRTVEQFLGIPVDYYIKVNMQGFKEVINLLGGVEVDNPFSFTRGDHLFPKGKLHLDGEQALSFVRMRKEDPRGDLGRGTRQRLVVKSLMGKAVSLQTVQNLDSLLQSVAENVRTNLSWADLQDRLGAYLPALTRVETEEIAGKGRYISHIYYYVVSETERERLHQRLQAMLHP